ncbi:MAG: hypothetical protein OZSIB_0426 [Candidatus Ozemobacter sibiricus]|uniref:Uncharacterized protein n=1 Tax=Candidatus Ozemobacter sibiricus TaxID=2268124 RepID=A0A367ZLT9_9BACT|nr:MAG: hypothetical protein OZSIB_0426 [Candidatus Ozemobacter sibiricus]
MLGDRTRGIIRAGHFRAYHGEGGQEHERDHGSHGRYRPNPRCQHHSSEGWQQQAGQASCPGCA